MKTSNIQTTHPMAVIRGWVDPLAAGSGSGGSTGGSVLGVDILNGGAVDLIAGDVVVLQSDGSIAPTTTVGYPGKVGVVADDIAVGDYGAVQWEGPVDLVNVTASVTAGDYAETSATAKKAQDAGATLISGSFAYFTSSGTTPSAFLLGAGGSGSGNSGGDIVPYYIPLGQTFTIPLYKQGLFSEAIEVDGALVVNGMLLGVS